MAYRPPKNQTLSSSATSVIFYYIGVSVAESGVTRIIGSVNGGVSKDDLSYTISDVPSNKNKDITIALGQGINPNGASAVTVRYTISIRGKLYAINY